MNANKRTYVGISMVKNEADIIETFVRYHQHIFDGMVILDNRSSDQTLNILNRLKEEGMPLIVIKDANAEYRPEQKFTELLYFAVRHFNPDMIFPLDADEFLIPSNPLKGPRMMLDRMADLNKIFYVKRITYVPHIKDRRKEPLILKRMIHARINDHTPDKVAVTGEVAKQYSPSLAVGNHKLLFPDQRPGNTEVLEGVLIAHYPIRSMEQLKSKIFVGWMNALSRYNKKPADSWQRARVFNQLKENPNITYPEFIQIAKHFAVKEAANMAIVPRPINLSSCRSLDLKYTPSQINSMQNLLTNYEALLNEYNKLKKELMVFKKGPDRTQTVPFKPISQLPITRMLNQCEMLAKEYAKVKKELLQYKE